MTDKVGLGLSTASKATFESYFVGVNTDTLERIRHGERIWLYGNQAVGKTHILRSLERESESARYIEKDSLHCLVDTVASSFLIDDVDLLCGVEENEFALFSAYEATDFSNTRWIVSATKAPHEVAFAYRDLASRMRLFERLELLPVPESLHAELLKFWATDRGIRISDKVAQFLLDRTPRTQHSLWQTLLRLEQATLLKDRAVTIPFVREVMGFGTH